MNSIQSYCQNHTTPHLQLLAQLERETHLKTLAPQMLTGSYQGQLLALISKMIRPIEILEIGTFTGYSALCLASGLQKTGRLTTIEVNPELQHISDKYFRLSEYDRQINFILGDALNIIPTFKQSFDLIFIDAAKLTYEKYFNLVFPKLNVGGFIIADNVLWSGKVIYPIKDKDTQSLDNFNKMILADDRVENIILPIRDGINLIRKC